MILDKKKYEIKFLSQTANSINLVLTISKFSTRFPRLVCMYVCFLTNPIICQIPRVACQIKIKTNKEAMEMNLEIVGVGFWVFYSEHMLYFWNVLKTYRKWISGKSHKLQKKNVSFKRKIEWKKRNFFWTEKLLTGGHGKCTIALALRKWRTFMGKYTFPHFHMNFPLYFLLVYSVRYPETDEFLLFVGVLWKKLFFVIKWKIRKTLFSQAVIH